MPARNWVEENPLLSEFAGESLFARMMRHLGFLRRFFPGIDDPKGARLAKAFFAMALTTSVLSCLAGADTMVVSLVHNNVPSDYWFGYWYELNAAPFYLLAVPAFIVVSMLFVRTAHSGLVKLAEKGRLTKVASDNAGGKEAGPLDVVAEKNRRAFAGLVIPIYLVSALIITATELCPPFGDRSGDFHKVKFGYVQVRSIHKYFAKGKTMAQIQSEAQKDGLKLDMPEVERDAAAWSVSTVDLHGNPERAWFWIFVAMALAMQSLYVPFAVWIVLKIGFFLWLTYRTVAAPVGTELQIALDVDDRFESFGLRGIKDTYFPATGLLFLGAVGTVASVMTNIGKKTFLPSHNPFGLAGQSLLGLLALATFAMAGAFLVLLWKKTRTPRNEALARIDAALDALPGGAEKERLEERRKRIANQNIWPSQKEAWFGIGSLVLDRAVGHLPSKTAIVNDLHLGLKWLADGFHHLCR